MIILDVACVDPRDQYSIINAVKAQEVSYNKAHPGAQRTFQTSEPCPTGLSVGAIVGIVIGSIVGVALIAGLVYYFACRNKDYTEGKEGVAGTYDMTGGKGFYIKNYNLQYVRLIWII